MSLPPPPCGPVSLLRSRTEHPVPPGSARDTGARPETEPRRGLRARIALQRDEVCALGASRAGGNGRTRQHDHVLPHGRRVRDYEGGTGAQETSQGTQASARGQAFPEQPSEPLLGGGLRGKRNKQPPPLDPVQGANVIGPRPGARFRNGLCATSPRVQTHSPPRSDGGTPARYRRKRGSTRPSAESRTRFPENASCRDRPGRAVGARVGEGGRGAGGRPACAQTHTEPTFTVSSSKPGFATFSLGPYSRLHPGGKVKLSFSPIFILFSDIDSSQTKIIGF